MRRYHLFTILILILFCRVVSGQTNLCEHLGPRETLKYKAYYNAGFIRIYGGDVTFSVLRSSSGIPLSELSSTGKTRPAYRWFYNIDDNYVARYRCDLRMPAYFEQHTLEGKSERHWIYRYDAGNNTVNIYNKLTEDTFLIRESPIPADILTTVYKSRFLPFDTCTGPQLFEMRTLINETTEVLRVTYHHREEVRLSKTGTFDTFYFTVIIPDGTLFKKKRNLNVYVTADGRRIPVLVEAPVKIGLVKAVYQPAVKANEK